MSSGVRSAVAEVVARTEPTGAGARGRFVWIHQKTGRVSRLEEVTGKSLRFDLVDVDEERDERFTCDTGEPQIWKSEFEVRTKYCPAGDATDHERLMVRIRADGRAQIKALLAATAEFAGLVRFIRFGPRPTIDEITEQDGVRAAYLRVPVRYSYVQ